MLPPNSQKIAGGLVLIVLTFSSTTFILFPIIFKNYVASFIFYSVIFILGFLTISDFVFKIKSLIKKFQHKYFKPNDYAITRIIKNKMKYPLNISNINIENVNYMDYLSATYNYPKMIIKPSSNWKITNVARNPFTFPYKSIKNLKYEEEERSVNTFFTWTIKSWKRYHIEIQLESNEFRDEMVEGISWRCRLQRQSTNISRQRGWEIKLRLYSLDASLYPHGKLFCEVVCFCEGSSKTTFASFYPGDYEYIMTLDCQNKELLNRTDIQVTCVIVILKEVPIFMLPSLLPTCGYNANGDYVTQETFGVKWHIMEDWTTYHWGPGVGVFSPLFSLSSFPGYVWQIHLYPNSDIDENGTSMISVFLKLVDAPLVKHQQHLEVDFEIITPVFDNYDTSQFSRSDTLGFRDCFLQEKHEKLIIEANMVLKVPLFV